MQWLIDILFGMVANYLNGMIVMWSGPLASIPDGWQICDGTNSTPDLRNRFVAGGEADAGGVPVVNLLVPAQSSGGSIQHTHSFTGLGHGHPSQAAVPVTLGSGEVVWDDGGIGHNTGNQVATGVTEEQEVDSVPFYALYYIMKL